MFVNEGQPHRHPSRLDHQQRFPGNNLGRFESGSTDTAVPGGSGRRRGGGGFDSPSPPIGFFLFGDDGGSSGNKGRGNMSSVGVIQNGDKAVHEASISLAAAHDEDDVGSAVRRSDGHGKGERGEGILASPDTRLENASRVLGGAGGARAPHILIAGGNGETVSGERAWEACDLHGLNVYYIIINIMGTYCCVFLALSVYFLHALVLFSHSS